MSRRQLFFYLLILCSAALHFGCGVKGPVKPLPQPLPEAAAQLTLHQQGEGLLLSWSLPRRNQDGSPLTDLAGFRIYRQRFEPQQDCPDCRQDWPLWRLLELDYLGPAQLRNGRLFVLDSDLEPGQGYSYRVTPFNRWGQDGPSVEARQILEPPPAPPLGLQAQRQEDLLRLRWQEPTLTEGMKLLGYQVYRRRPGAVFEAAPRNPELLQQPTFEDTDFDGTGRSFVYAVRTVVQKADQVLESALSKPLVITAPGNF